MEQTEQSQTEVATETSPVEEFRVRHGALGGQRLVDPNGRVLRTLDWFSETQELVLRTRYKAVHFSQLDHSVVEDSEDLGQKFDRDCKVTRVNWYDRHHISGSAAIAKMSIPLILYALADTGLSELIRSVFVRATIAERNQIPPDFDIVVTDTDSVWAVDDRSHGLKRNWFKSNRLAQTEAGGAIKSSEVEETGFIQSKFTVGIPAECCSDEVRHLMAGVFYVLDHMPWLVKRPKDADYPVTWLAAMGHILNDDAGPLVSMACLDTAMSHFKRIQETPVYDDPGLLERLNVEGIPCFTMTQLCLHLCTDFHKPELNELAISETKVAQDSLYEQKPANA
jgi:hypothetical protein